MAGLFSGLGSALKDTAVDEYNTLKNYPGTLYRQGRALMAPEDSEAEAFKAKQANINEYMDTMPNTVPATVLQTIPVTPLGSARYGRDPGEQRIDTSGMVRPLGSIRSYDEGGNVDKDQIAKLHAGEKVLNPEEAAAYETKGAPADFGGPVYPNPEGIKPKLDTEPADIPKASVKMDMSNPEKAQVIPGETERQSGEPAKGELASTKTATGSPNMKPLGGEPSKEEQAPDPMKVLADEKNVQAKDVAQQRATIAEDKKTAAAKGDLVGLGLAKIHENELNKSEAERSVMNEATAGINPPKPEYIGTLDKLGKVNPELAHNTLEQQRDDLKKALMSPDLATAGAARRQLAELNTQNPYGTGANRPGFLGKLEHGLAKAGNIAGEALAPGLMERIPGTEAYNVQQRALGEQEQAAGTKENLEKAQTEMQKKLAERAGAGKSFEAQVLFDLTHGGPNGGAKINPDTGKPYSEEEAKLRAQRSNNDERFIEDQMKQVNPATGEFFTREESMANLSQLKAQAKPERVSDEQRAIQQYYVDHPEAKKSLENDNKALQERAIAKQAPMQQGGVQQQPSGELKAVSAKAGQTLPPGTESLANLSKEGNKWYTYQDDKGATQYSQGKDIPEGAQRTEVEPKTFMNEARTANNVQQSLNSIAKDVHDHPEVWDSAAARNILATTLDQIDRQTAGLLIAGTGGSVPLPSGLGDMINTALQNKALDAKTSRALKDYISDYKSMKDQVIVMQMEMQGGKIGRGSQQAFKAIADQIPNGATPDSTEAQRQVGLLQRKQDTLSGKYPDQYQDYTKEKPYTPKGAGPATPPLPRGLTLIPAQ